MVFWDRFVHFVYFGMADSVPLPRATAGRIFEEALRRGRLQVASLNDLSVMLLLACDSSNTFVTTAAQAEALRRTPLSVQPNMWRLLQRFSTPSRLTDLLEVGRAPVPQLRVLALGTLIGGVAGEVLTNLCRFLGRLYLADPEDQLSRAVQLIHKALIAYYRLPLDTVDFLALLYRHVLADIKPKTQPLPGSWPTGGLPDWTVEDLDPDEFDFLDRCLRRLKPSGRVLLALQVYARLNVEQIAAVWQGVNQKWTADQVAKGLEQCWKAVL